MTSGLGLERPGLLAVRYPGVAAFAILMVLAASLWSVPKLRFDEDINRVFLSQTRRRRTIATSSTALAARLPI